MYPPRPVGQWKVNGQPRDLEVYGDHCYCWPGHTQGSFSVLPPWIYIVFFFPTRQAGADATQRSLRTSSMPWKGERLHSSWTFGNSN